MVWKNPWYDPSLKHHTPNGFRNTLPVGHQPGDLDRWRKARKEAGLPKPPALGYDDFIRQWWQPVELAQSHEDGVWWLGHASVLLQLDGNIIRGRTRLVAEFHLAGDDADRRAGTALEHAHAMEPQSFLMVRLGDGRMASPFLVQR